MKPADFRLAPRRPDCAELVSRFVSLGINCELGLVQRHCEAEPLGLLRFSRNPMPNLIEALDCGFEGIGDPDMLDIRVVQTGEYMATHRRFAFDFHTQMKASKSAEAEVREKISRHFRYLAGMLMDDLTQAEKIFVYRPRAPETPLQDAYELLARLHRYGPAILLWAAQAQTPEQAGTVEWIRPGKLMAGYLPHYSPLGYAANAAFDSWLDICRNADMLRCQQENQGK